MLLNNQQITEEIKEEIKKKKTPKSITCGTQQNSCKMEVYSNTSLPQKIRKISNKQLNLTPKARRGKEQNPYLWKERHSKDQSRNK